MKSQKMPRLLSIDIHLLAVIFLIVSPTFILSSPYAVSLWLISFALALSFSIINLWLPTIGLLYKEFANSLVFWMTVAYIMVTVTLSATLLLNVPVFAWDGLSFWLFHAVDSANSCQLSDQCPKSFYHRHPNTIVHLYAMLALSQEFFTKISFLAPLIVLILGNFFFATTRWLVKIKSDPAVILFFVLLVTGTPHFTSMVLLAGYSELFLLPCIALSLLKTVDSLIAPSPYNYLLIGISFATLFLIKNTALLYVFLFFAAFFTALIWPYMSWKVLLQFCAVLAVLVGALGYSKFRIDVLGNDVIWYGFQEGLKINSHRYVGPIDNFYIDLVGKRFRFSLENMSIVPLIDVFLRFSSYTVLLITCALTLALVPSTSSQSHVVKIVQLKVFLLTLLLLLATAFLALGFSGYGSQTIVTGASRIVTPLLLPMAPLILLLISSSLMKPRNNLASGCDISDGNRGRV